MTLVLVVLLPSAVGRAHLTVSGKINDINSNTKITTRYRRWF